MAMAAGKEYQNTMVRLPRQVYERVKTVVVRSQAASFNEFVVQAIEEKVRRLTEAEIDAAFAYMAHDADYQSAAISLTGEFEKSDWEAFNSAAPHGQAGHRQPRHEQSKNLPSKTRSR